MREICEGAKMSERDDEREGERERELKKTGFKAGCLRFQVREKDERVRKRERE